MSENKATFQHGCGAAGPSSGDINGAADILPFPVHENAAHSTFKECHFQAHWHARHITQTAPMRVRRNTGNFDNTGEGRKKFQSRTSYSIGCKTGNYSEVLLGVPQWTRTLSTGQECNCMSHLSLSFTQCQRRLPFKTLTICQESTLFKYTCNSTWTTSPPPNAFPSTPWNETKQKTKPP